MKVLLLAHPEMDYLEYYIFDGLCKILGDENVITYPFKKSYYGIVHDDYILDDGKTGNTGPASFMLHRQPNPWPLKSIIQRWSEFKLLIVGSPRTYALNAFHELQSHIPQPFKIPVAFIDGEDSITIRDDLIKVLNPDYVFKREITKERNDVFPLPFASVAHDFIPDQEEKPLDVFCSFGNTWHIRKKIRDLLLSDERLKKYKIVVGCDSDDNLIGYVHYLKLMAMSKINIVARGHGMITVRQFEAPSYSGLVLSDKIPVIIPQNWVDKWEIRYYKDDLSDLVDLIVYYLENDRERRCIGNNGAKKLRTYHTSRMRARYFLEKCGFKL